MLIARAHEAGVLLTPSGKSITEHLGDDAGRVAGIVDVLGSAHGDVRLGVDDVSPYLGEEARVPSYQLTNAIESGDPAALESLHRLMTTSSAQQPKPMHPLQSWEC